MLRTSARQSGAVKYIVDIGAAHMLLLLSFCAAAALHDGRSSSSHRLLYTMYTQQDRKYTASL
jgi:hypothetical protein